MLNIAYANVQGNVNKRTQTWRDIEDMCDKYGWHVMAFTETHWKEGAKQVNLNKYNLFKKWRVTGQRKG